MNKTKDLTEKQIVKKYGDVIRSGADVFDEVKGMKVIPVSPAIVLALGGGIREGSWVIFTGSPKTGKTSTALQFAATCQTEEYGNRPIIYLNSEGRLSALNLGGIQGLDASKITVVESKASLEPNKVTRSVCPAAAVVVPEPKAICVIAVADASFIRDAI